MTSAEFKITPLCNHCGDAYSAQRRKIGYTLCMPCGDQQARQTKHTIAPMNKSNYMYFSDPSLLKQLNPKRTT